MDEVEAKIAEARKYGMSSLDLTGTELTHLPESIAQLTDLTLTQETHAKHTG